MKKKTITCISIVVVLLIAIGVSAWYITKSEAFYPEHLKLGKFVAVNNAEKCYIYDEDADAFTGDYFTIQLKAKGFIDKGGMRIGEDGQGNLIYDDEKIARDEMFVMFGTLDEHGEIIFIANDVDIKEDGAFDKSNVTYTALYSSDFSELKMVHIHQDGEEPVIGYVADSLEEAEKLK
ncbi:MAG: hypothetical protein J6I97_05025 [Agathobacter sp.]|nr:hypothetical protein [Agathobacter sp.]